MVSAGVQLGLVLICAGESHPTGPYSDLFPVGFPLFLFYYMFPPAAFHLYHRPDLVSNFLRGSRGSLPARPLTLAGGRNKQFIGFNYDIFFDRRPTVEHTALILIFLNCLGDVIWYPNGPNN